MKMAKCEFERKKGIERNRNKSKKERQK